MSDDLPASYGVRERFGGETAAALAAERLAFRGFCAIPSGLDAETIDRLRTDFDAGHGVYLDRNGGAEALKAAGEHQTIRLLPQVADAFWCLLKARPLRDLLDVLFGGSVALNQMNGLVNPPAGETYGQARWHRDLPYQHFTSSRPLAINALFCLDPFTLENGATEVAEGSHRQARFPSPSVLDEISRPLTAPAGTFLVLDAMTFHRGGENRTDTPRRAVNHVFTIPPIRRQISFEAVIAEQDITDPDLVPLLTMGGREYTSAQEWLDRG